MKTIGVILSGCGAADGAEIRESVFTLLSLDQAISNKDIQVKIMAPNKDQHHVVNHLTGEEMSGERRNILVEAARVARGKIEDISKVDINQLDGLILPGGFGAAKNLSDYAFKGEKGKMDQQVASVVGALYERKKPIGAICISPAILTLLLGSKGLTVTIGNDPVTAGHIRALGASHQECQVNQCCFDKAHNIVTTPAYMYGNARLSEIFEGIDKCCRKVVDLVSK